MGFIENIVSRFVTPKTVERGMPAALLPANRAVQGSSVTVGEALTLPSVYRAISILTTTSKQMSIQTVRDDREVTSPSFIRQPNPLTSRSTFIEQTMVSLSTQGNAYWLIDRDSTGKLVALTPLNPLDMLVETDTAGRIIRYQYQGITYLPQRIKHLTLFQPPGSPLGLGPIQAASASLHGAIELRDYASQWFEKGGVPSGVLKTDQFVSNEQVELAKEAWNATAGAKNGVAVLGSNWNYTPVYLKPEELQFLQNQAYSVTEVARLFGVPATLMLTSAEGTSLTYSNVSQEWLAFIRFTLMQYLIVIEDALTDFLPGRQKAQFNLEAILRPDTMTRYESYKLAAEAGWMTVDEIRAKEDMPPLGNPVIVDPTLEEGETNV
jgi:HK97 family phage portal protein